MGALPELGIIEVTGSDAARYLGAQTTNDVLSLASGEGHKSCLLDRKAHVKALFDLFRLNGSFLIIVEKAQVGRILEHFEQFKFADKVEFVDLSESGAFFAVEGPRSRKLIANGLDRSSVESAFHDAVSEATIFGVPLKLFKFSLTGDEGFLFFVGAADAERLRQTLSRAQRELDLLSLDRDVIEIARVEAGILRYGVDVTEDNLLSETGLDQYAVSYSKGCFLGQEVLARVRSHGAPSRGMAGIVFAEESTELKQTPVLPVDTGFNILSEPAGVIKTSVFSPTLKKRIALSYLRREHRVPDKELSIEIDGMRAKVKVVLLPFTKIVPPADRARALYEEALALFALEKEGEESPQSIALLEEALYLDPAFEDALEALAVLLSRRERLDEAIELMANLSKLNPDSVMAHANLSVFYMQKGMIEEAEEEKAISMSIRMRLAAKEASIAFKQEEEEKKNKEEAQERMEMFKQVLEIDPDDLLANYGMGNCLVILGDLQAAVPHLEKAIEVKPMHSVAYVDLARALSGLGKLEDARDVLRRGIEISSRRGDMMPLKSMQAHLEELSLKGAQ